MRGEWAEWYAGNCGGGGRVGRAEEMRPGRRAGGRASMIERRAAGGGQAGGRGRRALGIGHAAGDVATTSVVLLRLSRRPRALRGGGHQVGQEVPQQRASQWLGARDASPGFVSRLRAQPFHRLVPDLLGHQGTQAPCMKLCLEDLAGEPSWLSQVSRSGSAATTARLGSQRSGGVSGGHNG